MLTEELVTLVQDIIYKQCELQNIELKTAKGGTPKLYDTLSSFSNQVGGGIIIFGIDEKNNYEITGVYDVQELQTKVTNQALQMQPLVRPVFTVAEIHGKFVVSAEISECDIFEKPCFYSGAGRLRGSYIRVGEADMPMTEYEIYSYEVFKRKIEDELRVVDRAELDDFDEDALNEYFIAVRREKRNLSKHPNEKIMQLQGITDKGKPTVAGILLFGEYPQAFFPQLSITAMAVPGLEIGELGDAGERFIDNRRIEGTIPQMIEEAMAFVRRNTKTMTIIDEDGNRKDKTEYPMRAVREIILNALIHRDYSIHTDHSPIRLIIYNDRLELENPGGLYGRITIDELGKVAADTRNPFIAGVLEILINTENRFSGIPTIYREIKKAGLREPIFENKRGSFKVIFQKNTNNDSNLKSIETEVNSSANKNLKNGLIEFCKTPRTKEEIAKEFGLDSIYYMMTRYIKPLIEEGILALVLPDKPRSKNQKYYSS